MFGPTASLAEEYFIIKHLFDFPYSLCYENVCWYQMGLWYMAMFLVLCIVIGIEDGPDVLSNAYKKYCYKLYAIKVF